jgi:hypothetical protein
VRGQVFQGDRPPVGLERAGHASSSVPRSRFAGQPREGSSLSRAHARKGEEKAATPPDADRAGAGCQWRRAVPNAHHSLSRARARTRGTTRLEGTHPRRDGHRDGAWSGAGDRPERPPLLSRACARTRGRDPSRVRLPLAIVGAVGPGRRPYRRRRRTPRSPRSTSWPVGDAVGVSSRSGSTTSGPGFAFSPALPTL